MSVINTNLKALITQDALNINNRHLSTAMERLSTGYRINSAKDDAAGLAISTRMDTQVRGLSMAIKNAHDGISVIGTAEGAMEEVTNMLQRMRELAIQSANDTNSEKDRKYLQDEIDQLVREIDRVSETTQFNSINVLDGTYECKIFQIGANQGQTMNISIGSMSSKVLGVALSNSAATAEYCPPPDPILTGTTAQGTSANPTVVDLEFLNNSGSDAYSMTFKDELSGLTAVITSLSVDLTNTLSKNNFRDTINLAFTTSQTDTTITGSSQMSSSSTSTINLTTTTSYDRTKFSISVDGGPNVEIDVRSDLLSTSGIDTTSVTQTILVSAIETQLQRLFDSRLSVGTSGGSFTITDDEGRRLKVTQGAGDGFLFGTDPVNCGALLARETTRNNLSVNWSANILTLTNSGGGKTTISDYQALNNSQILMNIVDNNQIDGLYDPVLLATSSTTNLPTVPSATFTGKIEQTQMSIRFSDKVGDGSSAEYAFKLTNGQGDIYAQFSGSGLDVYKTLSDGSIRESVLSALSSGVTNLGLTDSSIDISEWDVAMSGDHLLITNKKGRALAVEDFSSSAGYMTATPVNEPGSANILADKNAYYSETRIGLNTSAFGLDYSASGTDRFTFALDGVTNSANLTVNVNGSAVGGGLVSGDSFAASVQSALRGADIMIRDPNDGSAIATASLTSITVKYDPDTAELVIRDPAGRAIGFGMDSSANSLCNTGYILSTAFVTGPPNKMYTVDVDSSVAQGDVYNATTVTLDFSTSDVAFNFQLNGQYLDGSSSSTGSALIASNIIDWNAEYPFGSSVLKSKLDALMTELNSVHPRNVFEYSIFGDQITFYQRDGGEIILGGYVSSSNNRKLTAEVTPGLDQGEKITLSFNAHTIASGGTAEGTGALTTTATLNVEGDDIYSMKISNGTQSYSFDSTIVDISNSKSVATFVQKLEESLFGSNINATMDLDGNIFFTREDGGLIILQEFTSAAGRQGTWTPNPGQGNSISLTGKGIIESATTNSLLLSDSSSSTTKNISMTSSSAITTYVPIGDEAKLSVSNISISTQKDSELAIDAIDYALDYVQAERSNLGAIQNRLTHTIDNLSNIVTNTAASRSKIRDADYAKETAELSRTQIIQQAATAILAQANQSPQSVLQLLQ